MEEMSFPIRINKYLAHKGLTTRKGADKLIVDKKILINGKVATLGQMVNEKDRVEVKSAATNIKYEYYSYYKPRGVITHSPQNGEKGISDMTKRPDLFPIGRLDKDSEGLIILTNDGRITKFLLDPDLMHEKEYLVRTKTTVRMFYLNQMKRGMDLGDLKTKPCETKLNSPNSFSIILTEGKKHQIRRMCDALNIVIDSLKRVRILNIRLGKMKPNELRKIEGDDLKTFLSSLDIYNRG